MKQIFSLKEAKEGDLIGWKFKYNSIEVLRGMDIKPDKLWVCISKITNIKERIMYSNSKTGWAKLSAMNGEVYRKFINITHNIMECSKKISGFYLFAGLGKEREFTTNYMVEERNEWEFFIIENDKDYNEIIKNFIVDNFLE